MGCPRPSPAWRPSEVHLAGGCSGLSRAGRSSRCRPFVPLGAGFCWLVFTLLVWVPCVW